MAKAKALGASDTTVRDLKAYAVYYDKKKKREDKAYRELDPGAPSLLDIKPAGTLYARLT